MTDQMPPPQPGQPGEPSEEEMRQYVAQMRGAPVEQIVVELVQGLLNATQMKLGRNDGRLLIDTVAAMMQVVGPHVDDQLTQQVDEAVNQLRMAQVEAEKEVAQLGEPEPNDLATKPGPAAGGQQAAPQPPSQASKLWTPGV